MARKNWRYDPFTQTLTSLTIVNEAHAVPGGGPFYIQLAEVPLQEAPSSVTVAGYAEVAVAPGAGEFQVDYQYKTGLIRFNAADANDIVAVSYEGTGSPVLASDVLPIGSVIQSLSVLTGYLLCDGQTIDKATDPVYTALVDYLRAQGAKWQGGAGTQGKLPDLKSKFIVAGGAGSSYSIGDEGGLDSFVITIAMLPSHDHGGITSIQSINHQHGHWAPEPPVAAFASNGSTAIQVRTSGNTGIQTNDHTHSVSAQGGGALVENRPPYYALVFCMKY